MPWKTISGPEGNFKPARTAPEVPEMSFMDRIKDLPAAYRDVVVGQIKAGDPTVFSLPVVQPILLDLLKTHPELAKFAGATGGAIIGTPGGPPGMVAGGAAGASLMDSASQLAEMGSPEAPQSAQDALLRNAGATAEGALAGVGGAGGLKAAPKVLRFAASPVGGGLLAGGQTLYKTGDPLKALGAAGATALGLKHLPGMAKYAGKFADKIEAFAARAANGSAAVKAAAVRPIVRMVAKEEPGAAKAIADNLVELGWDRVDAEKHVAEELSNLARLKGEMVLPGESVQGLPGVVGPASPQVDAAMAQMAPKIASAAPAATAPISQEGLKQIMQLQAMAKQGGASRKTVAALAKELFPDNPEVVEMITGPMTTMSTIHVP